MSFVGTLFGIITSAFVFAFLEIPRYWWKTRNEPSEKKRCECLTCQSERDKFFMNRYRVKEKIEGEK